MNHTPDGSNIGRTSSAPTHSHTGMPAQPPANPTTGMPQSRPALSAARLATQLVGFAIGAALLAWCIVKAIGSADLDRLRHADLRLVATMVGVSALSMLCAGTAFWLALRPARRIPWGVHQAVNAMATLVNYAPVRLGVPSRFVYHMSVDGLGAWLIAGWVATVAACTLSALAGMTCGALVGVGAIEVMSWGAAVAIGLGLAFAIGTTEACVRIVGLIRHVPFVARKLGGAESMLASRSSLRLVAATRFIDFTMYAARAWCAGRILDLPLDAQQVLLVALAGYIMNYNPLGRFGFREATMAFVASRLAGETGLDVGAAFAQLALIESAGEALASIPLGAVGGSWCGFRILRARRAQRLATAP